jgi:endoglucanase
MIGFNGIERHLKLIREAGFETVRINLHALQLLRADPASKLPAAWLHTLDWAVRNALGNGLNVILDLHNYNDVAKDPASFKPRRRPSACRE